MIKVTLEKGGHFKAVIFSMGGMKVKGQKATSPKDLGGKFKFFL